MKRLIKLTASIFLMASLFDNSFVANMPEANAQEDYESTMVGDTSVKPAETDSSVDIDAHSDESLKIYVSDKSEYDIKKIYVGCNFDSCYGDFDLSHMVTSSDLLLLKKFILEEENQEINPTWLFPDSYVEERIGLHVSKEGAPRIFVDPSAFDVNHDGVTNAADIVCEMRSIIKCDTQVHSVKYSGGAIAESGSSGKITLLDASIPNSISELGSDQRGLLSEYAPDICMAEIEGIKSLKSCYEEYDVIRTYKIADYNDKRYLICIKDNVFPYTNFEDFMNPNYVRTVNVYEMVDSETLRESCMYNYLHLTNYKEIVYSTGNAEVNGLVALIQNYFDSNYYFAVDDATAKATIAKKK